MKILEIKGDGEGIFQHLPEEKRGMIIKAFGYTVFVFNDSKIKGDDNELKNIQNKLVEFLEKDKE